MSKKKNKEILESILRENLLGYTKDAIVSKMLEQEVAGQRIFYVWLKQHGYSIDPESMDKNQSDGIVGNTIIECKLDENEGGGCSKAYQELYDIIPKRLKQKGEKIPFYRIYIELKTFLVEVYDCHCKLKATFDWYERPDLFKQFFDDTQETYEYDLLDSDVDLVEVIQNIYKVFDINEKIDAYKYLEKGIVGWFKSLDIQNIDINRLILNNDKMNEKYVQKIEGAFFTPPQYIKISTQYVQNAISRSKEMGYEDYVIVDRCAGVGNLESQFNYEIYSHFILGTINKAEAFTANIRFNGLAIVEVVDALTKEGVDYYKTKIDEYKKKKNIRKLAVIFLENPPYAQTNSNKDGGIKSKYQKTWVHKQMEKGGEDLDEQFVYAAFKYYNIFSYVHYGPIKIWKSRDLINKEVKECYLCNKKYFNAGETAVALIHWTNKDEMYEELHFKNDIDDDFVVKKVHNTISEFYENDGKENGICVVEARNFSFDSPRLTGSINDDGKYGNKWIKPENLLKVLPLFCASRDEFAETGKRYPGEATDYRVVGTVYKSSDGGTNYQTDDEFLQNCLLYTLCTQKNGCSTNSKFWAWGEKTLSSNLKNTAIWKLYRELSDETKVNGLKNIESFNKLEFGKLWKEHNLYPKVNSLKELLREFYNENIRPKMVKYQILK